MTEPSGATREILDVVTALIAGANEGRALTAELTAALQDPGAWRMLQPTRYAGLAVGADDFVSVVSALAGLDGSVGWLTAMFNVAAYDIAGLPGGVADDVWGTAGKSLVAACYRPEGQLVRIGDGRRLTGRWRWVAGCELADWLLLTAADDSVPCRVLVPRREVHLEPVLAQNGLPAAGICDVTVSALPVPQQRIFQSARDRAEFEPVDKLPTPVVVGAGAAAAVVGSANGVWRTHVHQVRERLAASYGSEELSATAEVARAASDIDAAKLQLATSIHGAPRVAAWAQRQVAARARDAADRLLGSGRRHALDASDPVTRLWQDVHAGCRLTLRLLDGLDPG